MDVLFLMSIFRLYPSFEMSFEDNSVRKSLFLSACFSWDSRIFFTWDGPKKLNLVEPLVLGTRTWSFYFAISEYLDYTQYYMLLLEQCRHIVAKVRYRSMIGRWTNSSSLDHVTGLLFCLYVKLFIPSVFNSVEFWGSMSCIVLGIELADKKIQGMGRFYWWQRSGILTLSSKKVQTRKTGVFVHKKQAQKCVEQWTMEYSELSNILPGAVKGENFAKGKENWEVLGSFWIKRWKVWKTTAVPKLQISLMKKFGPSRVTHSDTRPHFTVQSVRQNCLVIV